MMSKLNEGRRDTIKALLAISAAGALAACKPKNRDDSKGLSGNRDLVYAAKGQFFNAKELVFLSAVAQTIMPKTDTAGAVEAGVPETIQSLVSEWGDDSFRSYWRAGLRGISNELEGNFATLSAVDRQVKLADYDSKVFSNTIEDKFYKDMKHTIVTAYYMSEPGATEELHYDPVPGDFRGCVPFSEIGKAWAT